MEIQLLDDDCLLHIFEYLTLTEIITLEKTSKIFDESIKMYYRTVKTFECNYRDTKLPDLIEILTRIAPFLDSFKFSGGFIMKDEYRSTLFSLLTTCKCLTKLTLNYVPIQKDDLKKLTKISNIWEELDLGNCHIEDDDYTELLLHAKNLKNLKINGNPMLTGTCLKNLSKIIKLDVSYCFTLKTEELCQFLKNCRTLKSLNVSGSYLLDWKELFSVMIECQSDLEELYMINLGVEGAHVPYESFMHLKVFEIKGRRLGT